jgi:biopolymer transport protein TolQ
MDALPSAAHDFSVISVFMRADWVVKSVMVGLALASLWSWTVIIDKFFRISALNRQADRFEDAVGSGRALEDVAAEAGDRPRHALPRMLQAALREWRDSKTRGGSEPAVMLISRIDRVLDSIIAREGGRVEEGLGSLAIVATASPFIGLFGTVWGIMVSVQGLANMKEATIATVAPGISEALVATAMGLFAAIPAVWAYNRFATRVDRISTRYDAFSEEFSSILQRQAHLEE